MDIFITELTWSPSFQGSNRNDRFFFCGECIGGTVIYAFKWKISDGLVVDPNIGITSVD